MQEILGTPKEIRRDYNIYVYREEISNKNRAETRALIFGGPPVGADFGAYFVGVSAVPSSLPHCDVM
jgi:hypothetical protein